jgi:hypothetical protein
MLNEVGTGATKFDLEFIPQITSLTSRFSEARDRISSDNELLGLPEYHKFLGEGSWESRGGEFDACFGYGNPRIAAPPSRGFPECAPGISQRIDHRHRRLRLASSGSLWLCRGPRFGQTDAEVRSLIPRPEKLRIRTQCSRLLLYLDMWTTVWIKSSGSRALESCRISCLTEDRFLPRRGPKSNDGSEFLSALAGFKFISNQRSQKTAGGKAKGLGPLACRTEIRGIRLLCCERRRLACNGFRGNQGDFDCSS